MHLVLQPTLDLSRDASGRDLRVEEDRHSIAEVLSYICPKIQAAHQTVCNLAKFGSCNGDLEFSMILSLIVSVHPMPRRLRRRLSSSLC